MMDRLAITSACAPPTHCAAGAGRGADASRHTALWDDESAATSVEYAILVSLIAGLIVAVVTMLGVAVQGLFTKLTW